MSNTVLLTFEYRSSEDQLEAEGNTQAADQRLACTLKTMSNPIRISWPINSRSYGGEEWHSLGFTSNGWARIASLRIPSIALRSRSVAVALSHTSGTRTNWTKSIENQTGPERYRTSLAKMAKHWNSLSLSLNSSMHYKVSIIRQLMLLEVRWSSNIFRRKPDKYRSVWMSFGSDEFVWNHRRPRKI